jgi:hypothetical protein
MEKQFRLCQHNMITLECPICKYEVKEKRIEMLINDERNVGKYLDDEQED